MKERTVTVLENWEDLVKVLTESKVGQLELHIEGDRFSLSGIRAAEYELNSILRSNSLFWLIKKLAIAVGIQTTFG